MKDRVDEEQYLRRIGRYKTPARETTEALGANVETYIKERLGSLRRNAGVVDAWRQLLPSELEAHCEISAIRGGVVEVDVDPGPYMHELRLLSAEIVGELQRCRDGRQIRRLALRPRREVITETEEAL